MQNEDIFLRETNASAPLVSIQMMRGVAAMLVVFCHAVNVVRYTGAGGRPIWLATNTQLGDLAASGVDLFFVISGFVMAHTITRKPEIGTGVFLGARFLRVVPMFWLLSLPYVALLWVIARPISTCAVVHSVTLFPVCDVRQVTLPALYVGWSLAFELAFYGLVALSLQMRPRFRLATLGATLLLLASTGAERTYLRPLVAVLVNPMMLEFLLGILTFILFQRWQAGRSTTAAIGVAGIGLMSYTLIMLPPVNTFAEHVFEGVTGLARTVRFALPWALILFSLLQLERIYPKVFSSSAIFPLVVMGDASYSLYLTHPLIMTAAEKYWGQDLTNVATMMFLLFVSALLLGSLTYRYVERPLMKLLRRRRIKQRAPLPSPLAAPATL